MEQALAVTDNRSQGAQLEAAEVRPPHPFNLLKATQRACAISSTLAPQGRACFPNTDKSAELACLALAFGRHTCGDLSKSRICKSH